MQDSFREFNLFLYWGAVNVILDAVLWCLRPYIDDSRPYGVPRLYLAVATRRACRAWLKHRGQVP